jgi:hypothetical protein
MTKDLPQSEPNNGLDSKRDADNRRKGLRIVFVTILLGVAVVAVVINRRDCSDGEKRKNTFPCSASLRVPTHPGPGSTNDPG